MYHAYLLRPYQDLIVNMKQSTSDLEAPPCGTHLTGAAPGVFPISPDKLLSTLLC